MQGVGLRLPAVAGVLLAALVLACGGDDGGVAGAFVARSPTPADATAGDDAVPETPSSEPSAAAPSATPRTPAPPTATPNADGVYMVGCGDLRAPLDKLHRLEEDCVPERLVAIPANYAHGLQEVIEATLPDLIAMLEAASAEGHRLVVVSSYRSYEQQRQAFEYHVNLYGLEQALRVSARPGHSEHQLGATVDLSSAAVGYELVEEFGRTPEGRWLAENAPAYGFILSYPEGLEEVTGYVYEPWHFRWVGRELAADVIASGLTLGEFLRR